MRLWGRMSSFFLSDEELGKKDDDHKPAVLPTIRSQQHWTPARPSPRKTLKRLALAVLIGFVVYIFIHNIPTDLPIRDRRRPVYNHGDSEIIDPLQPPKKKSRPPPPSRGGDGPDPLAQQYSGPLKFMNLAESLHAIAGTRGGFLINKNVLFTASSLKSAAALLPIACQMGSELRSYVHFALMSRSEIDIDELKALNGVDESCHVIFHGRHTLLPLSKPCQAKQDPTNALVDARPDYPAVSTEDRLANAAARALCM